MNKIIEGSLKGKIEEILPGIRVIFNEDKSIDEYILIEIESSSYKNTLNRYMRCRYSLILTYKCTEDKKSILFERLEYIMKNLESFEADNIKCKIKDKTGRVQGNELKVSFNISYKERLNEEKNKMEDLKILNEEREEN